MKTYEELSEEGKRLDKEINRLVTEIEQMIALARHKQNSSYYMRKENNPIILKRDGICKGNVLAEIIRLAKILDENGIAQPRYIHVINRPIERNPYYMPKEVS